MTRSRRRRPVLGSRARRGRARRLALELRQWLRRIAVLAVLGSMMEPSRVAAGEVELHLRAGSHVDARRVSNIALHVPPGGTASPQLPPGPFIAVWSGELTMDLRRSCEFMVEATGEFELLIDDRPVLTTAGSGGNSRWSGPVRLRKGPNRLVARWHHDGAGEAHFRLFWRGRGISPGPLPDSILSATNASPLSHHDSVRRGRALFLQYRCGICHDAGVSNPVPELSMDAPSFSGIGSRLSPEWMTRWILDPQSIRPSAAMPRLLGPDDEKSQAEARAIAAWLSSLRADQKPEPALPGDATVGAALFQTLRCTACHSSESDGAPDAISLASVAGKYLGDALRQYLLKPEAHYAWNPMPNFRLNEAEARDLAAFLRGTSRQPAEGAKVDAALVDQGRALAQQRGCLNCHTAPAETQLRVVLLADFTAESWKRGCLADEPEARPGVPRFAFSADTKMDLRAFGTSDTASLGRHVSAEFAGRWSEQLRCSACHEADEAIPRLRFAGEKLRPEWTARLLRGEIAYKPRPWLSARMPAFPAYAELFAAGFAADHGLPAASPIELPIDRGAAETGERLVSASGGFSCVSCHAVGSQQAVAVFDAPGIDLAYAAERLLPGYFTRWVRNPLAIDPGTKMPLYFDEEGNSPLADVYGGDGDKTIHALWQYFRQLSGSRSAGR